MSGELVHIVGALPFDLRQEGNVLQVSASTNPSFTKPKRSQNKEGLCDEGGASRKKVFTWKINITGAFEG